MAKQNTASELGRLIDKLQAERKQHLQEIQRIDTTFEQFGIEPDSPAPTSGRTAKAAKKKKRGRPLGSKNTKKASTKKKTTKKKTGRRRRQTFAKTGEESVFDFVKKAGKPTTAEVNDHWSGEGRGGKADNTLSKLVKSKKLKRENIKGERGSRYTA